MEPLLVVVGLVCSVVAGVVGDGADAWLAVAQSLGTSALSKQSDDPISPTTPH